MDLVDYKIEEEEEEDEEEEEHEEYEILKTQFLKIFIWGKKWSIKNTDLCVERVRSGDSISWCQKAFEISMSKETTKIS